MVKKKTINPGNSLIKKQINKATKDGQKYSLFELIRNKGFMECLSIFMEQPKFELTQTEFYAIMIQRNLYTNLFFRIRAKLIKAEIIKFKLNNENQKVLFLTKKGIRIMQIIVDIEEILNRSEIHSESIISPKVVKTM